MQEIARELENSNESILQKEEIDEKELETLQQVATQLITASGMQALYGQILDTALAILHADLASIQMVNPERGTTGELKLLGHRGFSPEAAKRWEWVGPDSRTTCGEALRTRRRVLVPDVRNCDFMAGSEDLEAFLDVGIRAAQSLPLVSRSGELLGMVTTYWRDPRELSVRESRALDILGRLAADVIERARTEEALWENQQRLTLLYDTVRDVIFHLAVEPDGQFRFVSVNAAFLRVTGLSREAVIGKTVNEVIPEASLTLVLGKYRQAIEQNITVLWEETSNYPTGSLTAEVSITPVLDKTGQCAYLVGSAHDITERKRAEALRRESEQRFRHMADAAPVMIWVTGRDRLCTFVNKRWLDFTGRPLDAELGTGWISGLHADDVERSVATYYSAFDARRSFQVQCRFRRADGEYRWILDNGVPLYRDDEFSGFIGSCIDITEQKLIEDLLRASEARLMSAERLVNLGSWERDDKTGNTEFSDEMLRILGMPDSPPRTLMEFLNYVHPEDRERVRESALRVRSTGVPGAGEYRIIRADGEVRFVRSALEVIQDDRGVVISVVGATQDITEFKRAQEDFFSHQKLESVGTLASGIAHDFNNVLGGVLAQADLALTELEDGSSPEQELKAIRNAAIRGSEVVRELLIYAGKDSEIRELVDLSQIVKEMLELLTVSISKHAILDIDVGQDLPAVRANPAQIRQIVMNLIVNASEALAEREGIIRLATRYVKGGKDSSALTSDPLSEGGYIELDVSDTGCGMSAETRARVFDPFFTTKSAGHGLGLAVVNGIVRSLHGKIHLTSKPGIGTTFKILLPCDGKKAAPDRESPASGVANFSERATVLVVDDEETLRQGVARMLRKGGFEVFEAGTGSAAIDLLRASGSCIDVILLDMTFPGPSIYEVVAEYAQVRPDSKVILTSAYSEEAAKAILSMPQVCGFIRKPFSLAALVKTLRDTLSS
jgi:PAS domain S-box-containing protein